MKYLKKFESFKINEGMTEDLVEALYKELTELKIEKGHFSEADYNDLMSKRGLEKGMQVEIFKKLEDKGFVFDEVNLDDLFKELTELKNKKGYFSVDDYYNLMDDKKLSGIAEDTFHKLVGMGFGFEDEPEEDDDDIILPSYNLN